MASAASIVAPKLTQAALARELAVSRQAINDLVKRGVLSVDRDGKIDLELARVAIANRVRPSGKTAAALPTGATAAPQPAARAAAEGTAAPDDMAVTSYHVAKTLRETAEARLAQLKLSEQRGEVIRVEAVRSALGSLLAATRDSLLQIPARLAPVLAAEADAAKVHDLMQAELHQALAQLTSAPQRLGRPAESDSNQPPALASQASAATENEAP